MPRIFYIRNCTPCRWQWILMPGLFCIIKIGGTLLYQSQPLVINSSPSHVPLLPICLSRGNDRLWVLICKANPLSYWIFISFRRKKLSTHFERKGSPQDVVLLPKTGIVLRTQITWFLTCFWAFPLTFSIVSSLIDPDPNLLINFWLINRKPRLSMGGEEAVFSWSKTSRTVKRKVVIWRRVCNYGAK